jgi:protein SCO1/2
MTEKSGEKTGFMDSALILAAILAAAAGVWLGLDFFGDGRGAVPPAEEMRTATLLPKPKPLEPFSLMDQDGKPLTLDSLKGHWTFAAIGYTSCPDVCPTTMATFNALNREISPEGKEPVADFLFISVDPERDTPERLAQYVRWFNPRFLGATGGHEQLQSLTRQLGVMYMRAEQQDTAMGYLVDHSASIVLLDPEARLTAIFSGPHDTGSMAADFETITKYYRN